MLMLAAVWFNLMKKDTVSTAGESTPDKAYTTLWLHYVISWKSAAKLFWRWKSTSYSFGSKTQPSTLSENCTEPTKMPTSFSVTQMSNLRGKLILKPQQRNPRWRKPDKAQGWLENTCPVGVIWKHGPPSIDWLIPPRGSDRMRQCYQLKN